MAKKYDPKDLLTYYRLGICYQIKGKFEKAIASYKKAVDLKPDFADGYYYLGNLLFKMNRVDHAITCFTQTLQLKPDYTIAHYSLGLALATKGLNQKATEHLQLYLNLSKDTTEKERIRSLIEKLKDK